MTMRRILRIGLLLVAAWLVLKVLFHVAGFLFNLLLVVGVIFVIWYVVTYLLGMRVPPH